MPSEMFEQQKKYYLIYDYEFLKEIFIELK